MAEINVAGMTLAEGVVETIVSIAIGNVEGARLVGGSAQGGPLGVLYGRPGIQGIEVSANSDETLTIGVHLETDFGRPMPEVADAARQAVVDAVLTQVGVDVAAVDVYIDSVQF